MCCNGAPNLRQMTGFGGGYECRIGAPAGRDLWRILGWVCGVFGLAELRWMCGRDSDFFKKNGGGGRKSALRLRSKLDF